MPQSFDYQGPLKELLIPSRGIPSFYYPANLTTVTNHYIRMDISKFKDSRFQQGIRGNFGPPVGFLPQLDPNDVVIIGGLVADFFGKTGVADAGGLARTGRELGKYLENYARRNNTGLTTAALNYLNSIPNNDTILGFFPGLRGIGHKEVASHIYLYTPDTVIFDYDNQWKSVSLREKFGLAADGASIISDMSRGEFGSAAVTSGNALIKALGGNDYLSTIAQMRGMPVNPFREVLFEEVLPRKFKFNFKFYPQTAKESEEIFNIVEQLAFHAAPEYAGGETGGFMIMPSVFDFKFMFLLRDEQGNPKEIENPWIRRMSTCGLGTVNVNYVPDDRWQAQEDGSPRAVDLMLEFHELEVMTKDRISRGF